MITLLEITDESANEEINENLLMMSDGTVIVDTSTASPV